MLIKNIVITSTILSLSACSLLPEQGPSKSQILDNKYSQLPYVKVENVSSLLVHQINHSQDKKSFLPLNNDKHVVLGRISVGDVLSIKIWEAQPSVLFATSQEVLLPTQTVNNKGQIFVPFLGDITVKNKTPEAVQKMIMNKLAPIANQAQVFVQLVKSSAENVTIVANGAVINMPLTFSNERILDAIATIKGVPGDIADISVQLTRHNQVKMIPLELLTKNNNENIQLQPGDIITLLNNPLHFTALGALGNNKVIKFSANGLSLAEAIGKTGGLDNNQADPKGVFIFRYRPFAELTAKTQQDYIQHGYNKQQSVPFVYQFDFDKPDTFFNIQQFQVQNNDVLYVSNAPLAEYNKFLRLLFSTAMPVVSTAKQF